MERNCAATSCSRAKTLLKAVNFLRNIGIRANDKSFMNEDLVVDWFHLVWCLRPGALLKPKNALVLDSSRGHVTEKVKKELHGAGTDMTVIPDGITSQLQSLKFKCQV